jgi:hypothetical protein
VRSPSPGRRAPRQDGEERSWFPRVAQRAPAAAMRTDADSCPHMRTPTRPPRQR